METTWNPIDNTAEAQVLRSMLAAPQAIYYLPPWNKADFDEKKRLVLYNLAIYMPVAFLISILVTLYITYVTFLVVPMICDSDDRPDLYFWQSKSEHEEAVKRGIVYVSLMTSFIVLFMLSFLRASLTPPGFVPNDPKWDPNDPTFKATSVELKKDGSSRACARCIKLKPDRCHHCRLCDACILKMDHHCPWIANCVGFYNYRYFFLIVTYAMLSLWLFIGTFWEALLVSIYDSTISTGLCFFLLMVYSLAGLLSIAVTGFWIFHITLMVNNTTTIEYCEKRRTEGESKVSPYNLNTLQNFKEALGQNPLVWFLPFCKV